MATAEKLCKECGKPLYGRVDKKFCNDWCRNSYNNKRVTGTGTFVKTVNSILKRNRSILEKNIPENRDSVKTNRKRLLENGFMFEYFTNIQTTRKGSEYYFCYEYGYQVLENGYFYIIKKKIDA
jgi:predicted nucleic acid-binding Zn ribbon protein